MTQQNEGAFPASSEGSAQSKASQSESSYQELLTDLLAPRTLPTPALNLRPHRFQGEKNLLARICGEFPELNAQILRVFRSQEPSQVYRWLRWDRVAARAIDRKWDRLVQEVCAS